MDLKVGMLCPFYPNEEEVSEAHIGGVERHIQSLSRELSKLGVNVTVITSFNRNIVDYDGDIKIIRIKRNMMLFRTPFFKWKNEITNEFDIIHTHATYPFLSDISAKKAHQLNIPSILTYHFDGKAYGFIGSIFTRLYYLTYGNKMMDHSKIIATTRSYREGSRFLRGIPQNKVKIIPNGVNIGIFNPYVDCSLAIKKYNLKNGYVLFIGRFVKDKGLNYLVKGLKLLIELDPEVQVVIVGGGPLKNDFFDLVNKMKLNKHIYYLGYLPQNELPPLYRTAKVTVLSSVRESFGMTLVESMACGTPVVGTDIPGVKDIAILGGVVVPKGDSRAFANGIKQVMEMDLQSEELFKFIKDKYSWEIIAKNILDLYVNLVRETK